MMVELIDNFQADGSDQVTCRQAIYINRSISEIYTETCDHLASLGTSIYVIDFKSLIPLQQSLLNQTLNPHFSPGFVARRLKDAACMGVTTKGRHYVISICAGTRARRHP